MVPSLLLERPYDPRPLMENACARLTAGAYRFAVFGDTHHDPAFARIQKTVLERGHAFAVSVGDLVDLGGGREAALHYGKLHAEAGAFFRSLPVWTVLGNHDSDSRWNHDHWNGWANFKSFFNLEPHYAFSCRNAKFVCLSWMLPDAEELAWLKVQLAESHHAFLFVVMHYPLHTLAQRPVCYETEHELKLLFAQHRVTAVFSGHDHHYFRGLRDGTCYAIAAGASQRWIAAGPRARLDSGDSYIVRTAHGHGYAGCLLGETRSWPAPPHFLLEVEVTGSVACLRTLGAEGEILEETLLPARVGQHLHASVHGV